MQVTFDNVSRRRHLIQIVIAMAGLAVVSLYFLLASVALHAGIWILALPVGGLFVLSGLALVRSVRSLLAKGGRK